jgi:hypothetical protein
MAASLGFDERHADAGVGEADEPPKSPTFAVPLRR